MSRNKTNQNRRFPTGVKRTLSVFALTASLLFTFACGGSPKFVQNTPSGTTTATVSTTTANVGQQMSATITNVPTGTVVAPNVNITLTLVSGGATAKGQAAAPAGGKRLNVGDSIVIKPDSVSQTGSTIIITFTIPGNLGINSGAVFNIVISGTTSLGNFFTSLAGKLNLNPALQITVLTPNLGSQGQSVNVTITASGAKFAAGTSTASFGPGISVGGGPVGDFGPLNVTNDTTAVAALVIAPNATIGGHSVSVKVGSTQVVKATAFTVNGTPIANAGGPYTADNTVNISFNGGGSSDPEGGAITYAWDFGDGSTANTKTPSHAYAQPGTYTVTLTVTDAFGATSTATISVVVTQINRPPVANAGGPYGANDGTPISFNGAGSTDPDNNITTYSWSFGDGSTATGSTPSHTFVQPGTYTVTLTVTDAKGATSTSTVSVVITQGNRPPVANAGGPYTADNTVTINFSGAGSTDPDNNLSTYSWDFGDGSTATGATPSHAFASPGTYTVTLTVTDAGNLTSTAAVSVVVTQINRPPMASAGGPYAADSTVNVNFDGSGSTDPDNNISTYSWDFGDGSAATGSTTSHAYAQPGTYTVTLTVTDAKGATSTSTVSAVIAQINRPPVANAGGPYSVAVNDPVNLNGGGSTDPDGDTLTYSWNFGDSSNGTGSPAPHTYTQVGDYTVTLTVDDGRGHSVSSTVIVRVTAANQPPVAKSGGPYIGQINQTVNFNGGGSTDPENDPLTYSWDLGDGTIVTGATPSHTYTQTGHYIISVTVSDDHGHSVTTSTFVDITPPDNPPTANPGGPYTGSQNKAVSFSGAGSTDPDNDNLGYSWDFGDGTTDTGMTPSHVYAQPGTYTVTLTVSDFRGGTDTKTASAVISAGDTVAPVVSITAPAALALFAQSPVTVSGSVTDATDATDTLTVLVNGVVAIVDPQTNTFTANNVTLKEGNNILTAVATDPYGNTGTATLSVQLDSIAPTVSITMPSDGASLTDTQVTVTGSINDLVSGTVNAENATVTINGIPATVSNRTYVAPDVPLTRGLNTIIAVAKDKAGNQSQTTVQVNVLDETQTQRIVLLSGNNQTGQVGSLLNDPLEIQVVDANGRPVEGANVTFTVTRSDGIVQALPNQGQQLVATTDQNGLASVLFQLGTRAGVGNNEVTVTSVGFEGQTVFSASSTVGPPSQIVANSGDNQDGIAGQSLPKPFEVLIFDSYGNPVSNVPVIFTVKAGGGSLSGNPSATVNTDSDGKTSAILTLGAQDGVNNNVVEATFTNNTGPKITFMASGSVPGDPAQTTFSGVVLDNANGPVPGATASIVGTAIRAVTDDQGRFTLTGVPVGTINLLVDGRTSTRPESFPFLSFQVTTVAGKDNTLGMPFLLPPLDTENSQIVGGDTDVVLQMKDIPGYTMTIKAGSATFPDGSHVGRMSLSQVNASMIPMQTPNGTATRIAGTLQPAGVVFNPPIQVQFPNTDGLAPGTVVDIYSYDHDLEQFVSQGPGRVSADGSVISSDPGFGITKAGWQAAPPPPPPKTCGISCSTNNACQVGIKNSDTCSCDLININEGGSCGGEPGENSCKQGGKCQGGACTGTTDAPNGTACDDGLVCTENDKCDGGACKGDQVKDGNPANFSVEIKLDPIINGLEEFSSIILGQKISASLTFQEQFSKTTVCCENLKKKDYTKVDGTFQLNAKLATDLIPIPFLSFNVRVAKVGVFGQLGVNTNVQLTNSVNCDGSCWGGGVSAGGSATLAVGAVVPGVISVTGGGTVGLKIQAVVSCQAHGSQIDYGLFYDDVKVSFDVDLFDGTFGFHAEKVLIPGGPIVGGSIPLPNPQ